VVVVFGMGCVLEKEEEEEERRCCVGGI